MTRAHFLIGFFTLAGAMLASSGYGQDTKKDTQPAGKVALPANWSKLGITADQKKKIYDVIGSFQAKIASMKDQITQLQKDEYSEAYKLLNADQKKTLKTILDQKADPTKKDDVKKVDVKKGGR